jgi:hypothetical protein
MLEDLLRRLAGISAVAGSFTRAGIAKDTT